MKIQNQINIILNHFKLGDYKFVIEKAKELSKKNPNNSYLKNLIGSALLQIGDIGNAISNFKLALQLSSNNIAAINNLASCYKRIADYENAEKYYLRAIELNPKYENAIMNYGNLKMNMSKLDDAINLYKKVLTINPNNFLCHFSIANAYQVIGNFIDSKKHTEKVLEINPNFTPGDKLLSSYLKYEKNNKHFLKMEKNINNVNISLDNKVYLHFAIAKAFEDMNNLDEFIHHIHQGNEIQKKIIKYDLGKDIDLINRIKSTFKDVDYEDIEIKRNSEKIIFVLGMPRSGTSLVEQIISAHNEVLGAGELPYLRRIILNNLKTNASNERFILDNAEVLNKISTEYLHKISMINENKKIILDKSLLNFLWIGLIRILFPNSKIIHVNRNSKDTCFSCYKQLFANGLGFTYDQKQLTKFYNEYKNLMNFWNKKINNFIYTVNYEELIYQPEKNIQNILQFCELTEQQSCFKFYENKSPIRTMSSMQARKKIYKTSIGAYKQYENKLSELFDNLEK